MVVAITQTRWRGRFRHRLAQIRAGRGKITQAAQIARSAW